MRKTLLLTLLLTAMLPAARVYVDGDNSNGPWTGQSWRSAFQTVQEGLDAAAAAGGGEVWVAAGIYKPTSGVDRAASIKLRGGVALYGGFQGTETRLEERDWARHVTTLSGDIGREGVREDNSHHVVTGTSDAVIDGFVIAHGYGFGGERRGPGRRGGGRPLHITPQIVMSGPSPGQGAGMINYQAAPTVRNCTFRDNHAGKGGAMYNMASSSFPPRRGGPAAPAPLIISCIFEDNSAVGRGGAMANDLGTHPTILHSVFRNNSTEGKGGAIYNDFGCSPKVVNSLFTGNSAFRGGATGNDGGSSPVRSLAVPSPSTKPKTSARESTRVPGRRTTRWCCTASSPVTSRLTDQPTSSTGTSRIQR